MAPCGDASAQHHTPSGLAHILLIVAALVRLGLTATVLLSIFAHARSASPGIRLYARQIARLGADTPEYEELSQRSTV